MLRLLSPARRISVLTVNHSFRELSVNSRLCHGDFEWEAPKSPKDIVNVIYIDRHDIRHEIAGKVGDNLMFLAHRHDLDIEGACESALVSLSYCQFI